MIRRNLLGGVCFALGICCWLLAPQRAPAQSGDELWGENLVENSSFEQGTMDDSGWLKRSAFSMSRTAVPPTFLMDGDVARTGKKSLRIAADADTTAFYSLESKPVPVEAGRNYKVAGWIKTEDVKAVGRQPLYCNLHIRFSRAGGVSVPIQGSRVVVTPTVDGSADWTLVERIVTAPEQAVEARAGCVLTCSGTAWFDDLAIYPQLAIPWQEVKTDRITFLYEGDDAPTREKISSTEEHLAAIESALGVKHEDRIDFYNYRSIQRKEAVTGNAWEAHYVGSTVHTIGWEDKHKLAHMVLRPLGESTLLLREGLAMYLSQKTMGIDLHSRVRRLSRTELLPSVKTLCDDRQFKEIGADLSFPAAGSFVRFLVEEYGMQKVKLLYSAMDPGSPAAKFKQTFQQIIRRDFLDAEAMWRTSCTPG